jgi:hypothetical protein
MIKKAEDSISLVFGSDNYAREAVVFMSGKTRTYVAKTPEDLAQQLSKYKKSMIRMKFFNKDGIELSDSLKCVFIGYVRLVTGKVSKQRARDRKSVKTACS